MTDAFVQVTGSDAALNYIDNETAANTAAPGGVAKRQRVAIPDGVMLSSTELGNLSALTNLRDLQVAQRYTVLADSVADGLATFWTLSSAATGANPVVSSGEGVISPGTANGASSQMTSVSVRYFPGQSHWLNSALRWDAGVTNNTRRAGAFTVTGTAPQDGFCFEMIDAVLYASVYKAGVAISQVASTAWSRVASDPFTMDANYHSFEIRWTANGVQFYVDNKVRHVYSGTTAAITATLDFPITLQSINTGVAGSSAKLYVRNIGLGRFGTPPQDYTVGTTLSDQAGAGAVLTFTFPFAVNMIWVTDIGSTTTNISRVDAFGGTPSATKGAVVMNGTPTPIQVTPPSTTVKVFAPTGSTISMMGHAYS